MIHFYPRDDELHVPVDREGAVAARWPRVRPADHAEQIIEALAEL